MAFWNWFQRSADKIQGMKWSPENAVVIQALNDQIPVVLRKALFAYIKVQYNKSEQIAMASLEQLRIKLNEII